MANHSYVEDGHPCRGGCGLICECMVEDGYCENAGWRCENCRNADPTWWAHIERSLDEGDDSDYYENY